MDVRKVSEKVVLYIVLSVMIVMTLRFVFVRSEVPPPPDIAKLYTYKMSNILMWTFVIEKESGRTVFIFNCDSGPYPKKIEKQANGDWSIIMSSGVSGR